MQDGINQQAELSRSVWEKSKVALQQELDPQIYSAYIKPLDFLCYDQTNVEFTVNAPSRFICHHVDARFGDKISTILASKMGLGNVKLKFSVGADETTAPRLNAAVSPHVVIKRLPRETSPNPPTPQGLTTADGSSGKLNLRYSFDSFVVGSGNQFCHAAARRVAEQPGESYNPLFIYGGVGLGKTHLLHAIGNTILSSKPGAKVFYLSAEMFTNELIHALRTAKMDEFKNWFRGVDVLLLDDIQFMQGKERTQEEFFHTFNALYGAKHQIVITSDRSPQEIPGIEERLITRFSWGLTADLQAPDFETRVAIIKRKAASEEMSLPEEVALWMAEVFSSNVRELEGALTRLHALTSLQQVSLSLEIAQTALKPLLKPKVVNVSVDDIKRAVATHFNIKVSDIVSKRRTRNLSFPRHIAMYLCRKHTTASYPEIGSKFGGRDHSSVIHAANVVGTKLLSDQEIKRLVAQIEQIIFGE